MVFRVLTFRFMVLGLSLGSFTQAAVTWNLTYNDVVNNTGIGFDDAALGTTRQATFNSVLGYISSIFNHSGSADITINNSQSDGTGFLASAGPLFFTGPDGFNNGFVFDHLTTGIDPLGGTHDGSVTFDFGYTWNSDTGAPAGGEYDMYTVALHEFTHALGFLSLLDPDGTSGVGAGGNPGVYSVYDSFLELGDGTKLFNGADGDYTGTAADLISGDVYFNGPNASAANGGPVQVYAPGTFNDGSSISHITNGDAVMQFSIGSGVQRRTYSAPELGIFQDIGYSLIVSGAAAPEPGTLSLLGLGLIVLRLVQAQRGMSSSSTRSLVRVRWYKKRF